MLIVSRFVEGPDLMYIYSYRLGFVPVIAIARQVWRREDSRHEGRYYWQVLAGSPPHHVMWRPSYARDHQQV